MPNSSIIKDDDKLYSYGSLASQMILSDDFDATLQDLADYM